jgi:membrane-associated protein
MAVSGEESDEHEARSRTLPHFPKLRWVLVGVLAVVLVLWLVPVLLDYIDNEGGLEGLDHPYLLIGAFVAFDAALPILPSESLLTTASTLAAQGGNDLVVSYVIVAGGIGALVGDSMLYWISRTFGRRVLSEKLGQVEENERVALVMQVLGRRAPLLITVGRFVPGVRFAVNATMGISQYPYPRFLLWSTIGAFSWSAYTCAFSYRIGQALDGYPVASILTSAVITTALISLMYFPLKRSYDEANEGALAPSSVS